VDEDENEASSNEVRGGEEEVGKDEGKAADSLEGFRARDSC
jgi:hypothetical protein